MHIECGKSQELGYVRPGGNMVTLKAFSTILLHTMEPTEDVAHDSMHFHLRGGRGRCEFGDGADGGGIML
jgi:hypothetical protein